jgi:hypothetical protein
MGVSITDRAGASNAEVAGPPGEREVGVRLVLDRNVSVGEPKSKRARKGGVPGNNKQVVWPRVGRSANLDLQPSAGRLNEGACNRKPAHRVAGAQDGATRQVAGERAASGNDATGDHLGRGEGECSTVQLDLRRGFGLDQLAAGKCHGAAAV